MPDAQILAMPMKFGLEFVAIIRLDRVYSKGKIFPHIVDEFNCVFLRMSVTCPPFLPSAMVRAFCAFSRPDCHIGHGAAPQLAGILLLNTPYLIVSLATYWSYLFYCHTICGVSFLCHPDLYSL